MLDAQLADARRACPARPCRGPRRRGARAICVAAMPDAAGGRVDQDALTLAQAAVAEQRRPRGRVVRPGRRRPARSSGVGQRDRVVLRDDDLLGVAAEARPRHHAVADRDAARRRRRPRRSCPRPRSRRRRRLAARRRTARRAPACRRSSRPPRRPRSAPGRRRARARALLDLQDLGPARAGDRDDAHGATYAGMARASRRAARFWIERFRNIPASARISSAVASTFTCGGTPCFAAPYTNSGNVW